MAHRKIDVDLLVGDEDEFQEAAQVSTISEIQQQTAQKEQAVMQCLQQYE
jgi:hypothetical protein